MKKYGFRPKVVGLVEDLTRSTQVLKALTKSNELDFGQEEWVLATSGCHDFGASLGQKQRSWEKPQCKNFARPRYNNHPSVDVMRLLSPTSQVREVERLKVELWLFLMDILLKVEAHIYDSSSSLTFPYFNVDCKNAQKPGGSSGQTCFGCGRAGHYKSGIIKHFVWSLL